MSVAVCRSPASGFESILMLSNNRDKEVAATISTTTTTTWLQPSTKQQESLSKKEEKATERVDIWSSIQANKDKQEEAPKPYVHPLARRSTGHLSQKSLEICTESLGSESGSFDESDIFFTPSFAASTLKRVEEDVEKMHDEGTKGKQLTTVNYHCCISSRRSSPPRSFPPPLPSISRRDGPCLQMRPHRRDGRLIVEAVTVPSQNYLHAERQNGRLLLSFINTNSTSAAATKYSNMTHNANNNHHSISKTQATAEEQDEEAEEEAEEEEEEEEVEVMERRTVVEVKVSTQQPQQQSGSGGARVHRSSIVINKFVSCAPDAAVESLRNIEEAPTLRRVPSMTSTTAAAAAVAASSISAHCHSSATTATTSTDKKLLFTSKRRNREELLHDMRRCSQLRKPLFIWEPCCIAASSS